MSNIAKIPYVSGYPYIQPALLNASGSTFGIIFSHEATGGYQEFATIAERDQIPVVNLALNTFMTATINEDNFSSGRRRVGMNAYVANNNQSYRLIPFGYFGNGGTLTEVDWNNATAAQKVLALDPRCVLKTGSVIPGYGFRTIGPITGTTSHWGVVTGYTSHAPIISGSTYTALTPYIVSPWVPIATTDVYVTGGTVSGATNLILGRNDGHKITVNMATLVGSGSSGSSGISGTNGSSGSSGISGTNGSSGSSGSSGTAGSSGTSGINGSSGSSGTSGINGSSGATGSNGTSGISGSFGTSGSSGTSADAYTFPNDLIVSLSGTKTFGKYINGSTIPATGKTPAQVIQMAIVEAINPTVVLNSSSTIGFNQTSIENVLTFSYTILSLGATVASVLLEWRRNNTGSWTTLDTASGHTMYTHIFTDSNYNTQPFNYRYTVTDTAGGSTVVTKDITPAAYVPPTIGFTVAGVSLTLPETASIRENGNISSNISGTITRNSPNVSLISYTIQYQVNGTGSWINIGSAVTIGPGTSAIVLTNHNDSSLNGSTSLVYRILVLDNYQIYLSSSTLSSTSTVSFFNLIFYGAESTPSTNSAGVRALGTRIFTNGTNPFLLNTGTSLVNYTAAMPATIGITQVLDLDSLGANITSNYVLSTFNVQDFSGNNVLYNIYTMTNAIPYSSSHRHQITRA